MLEITNALHLPLVLQKCPNTFVSYTWLPESEDLGDTEARHGEVFGLRLLLRFELHSCVIWFLGCSRIRIARLPVVLCCWIAYHGPRLDDAWMTWWRTSSKHRTPRSLQSSLQTFAYDFTPFPAVSSWSGPDETSRVRGRPSARCRAKLAGHLPQYMPLLGSSCNPPPAADGNGTLRACLRLGKCEVSCLKDFWVEIGLRGWKPHIVFMSKSGKSGPWRQG